MRLLCKGIKIATIFESFPLLPKERTRLQDRVLPCNFTNDLSLFKHEKVVLIALFCKLSGEGFVKEFCFFFGRAERTRHVVGVLFVVRIQTHTRERVHNDGGDDGHLLCWHVYH